MKFRAALLSIVLILSSFYLFAKDDDKAEAPVVVRLAAASKVLKDSSSISLVYVKGLVCPSCAIGVRKNLSKMKGGIKKRFRDGIDMNPETQLVTIALKAGAEIDNKDLIERVEDAGYVAVEEYKLHDGHLMPTGSKRRFGRRCSSRFSEIIRFSFGDAISLPRTRPAFLFSFQSRADEPIMNMMPRWSGGWGYEFHYEYRTEDDLLIGSEALHKGFQEEVEVFHMDWI